MQLQRRIHSWWVAVPIGVMVCRAFRREVPPLWRLRKLPNLSKADPTICRRRRVPWKRASWRRRTNIVGHKKHNRPSAGTLLNVFGCHDADFAFLRRNSGTIDASAKSSSSHCIHPCVDVSLLLWQHPATLFDVEKNDGVRRKALPPCGSASSLPVRFAEPSRISLQ